MKTIGKFAKILFGLGFGDEGKGTMTDYLCNNLGANLVVRYNGGSQAAHNVVTDDGRHHTFSQIGSGAFVPGVKTLISKFMLWDPIKLALEVGVLSPKIGVHALNFHYIDYRAPVITPFHIAANQIKEWMRGKDRHGSCGQGVGETACDLLYYQDQVLRAGDLSKKKISRNKLIAIQQRIQEDLADLGYDSRLVPDYLKKMSDMLFNSKEPILIAEAYAEMATEFNIISCVNSNKLIHDSNVIFEGAQGVLLDEWRGFHPYTTWSNTLPTNALDLINESGFDGDVEKIGIIRTYGTRHGAGPFVTEDQKFLGTNFFEHNDINHWQGDFRTGGFDGVKLRYAIDCVRSAGGIDSIALTHVDSFKQGGIPFADDYILPSGEILHKLVLSSSNNLGHQETLTKLLQTAVLSKMSHFSNLQEMITYLAANAKVPVKYQSFGPKTKDKITV